MKHSSNSQFGIGSKIENLLGRLLIINNSSSLDTGSKHSNLLKVGKFALPSLEISES